MNYGEIFSIKGHIGKIPYSHYDGVAMAKIASDLGDGFRSLTSKDGSHSCCFTFQNDEGEFFFKAMKFGLDIEIDAYKKSGIYSPELLKYDTGTKHGFQYLITETIDTTGFEYQYMPFLLDSLKRFHKKKHSGFGIKGSCSNWNVYMKNELFHHIYQCWVHKFLDITELVEVQEIFSDIPKLEESSLLHGDLSYRNICLMGDKIVLIDWGDAIYGDPLFDVANFCAFHMPDQIQEIRDYYGPHDEKLFWKYYLRIVLARTVHRINFGIPNKPGFPPASDRIPFALNKLKQWTK